MADRRTFIGIGAAAVLALVTGCTGGATEEGPADFSGEVTGAITVLTNRTDLATTALPEYAKKFAAKYPGTTVTFEPVTNYEGDVTTQLSSGEYGDVLLIPNTVAVDQLGQFFEPLGTTADLKAKYRFVDEKAYDGQVYGLSIGGVANGFVVNTKVWAQAGITAPPKTPEEFVAGLSLIDTKTPAIPFYTNYKDGWPLSFWNSQRAIFAKADANETFPADASPWQPGKVQYVTDGLLFDIVKNKLTEPDPLTTNWEGSKPMLGTGKVASMLLGSWAIPQMKDAATAAGANPDDIAFWPFPWQTGGKFHTRIEGDYKAAVSKTSENKATAKAWLEWFVNESGFSADQQAIPPAIGQELPAALEDFQATGVELMELPAAAANSGKEDQIIKSSEIDLAGNIYRQKLVDIARGAAKGDKESYFAELNKRWGEAQSQVMK
ncbi:ABC-type glycerol-3-phosphate transport system substrate-binding protein [Actinoplanes lutulentus]|uniref:ABC-type glycerol-3-phosphate transport system substrate-binding protein n=1 Tax=Actinoplanes lutulentus TaxID=1287878 RepID=A0A327YYN1_9ACTN|nr:ABC transporter substrate-binding protein [Actinoplanes lutulentus]MBB2943468.1 ABC-type glycerol-3-phosphate transport system substrate-binding protein [Actinoplanes lutulentus]RAK26013.1 ABC-type glycerol-3-phosphate transport system substrate-binding protein [Actinoplanes lutulentus]